MSRATLHFFCFPRTYRYRASATPIHQTLLRSRANTEMGLDLHQIFLEAELFGPAWRAAGTDSAMHRGE